MWFQWYLYIYIYWLLWLPNTPKNTSITTTNPFATTTTTPNQHDNMTRPRRWRRRPQPPDSTLAPSCPVHLSPGHPWCLTLLSAQCMEGLPPPRHISTFAPAFSIPGQTAAAIRFLFGWHSNEPTKGSLGLALSQSSIVTCWVGWGYIIHQSNEKWYNFVLG